MDNELATNIGDLLALAVAAALAPMVVGLLRLKIAEVVILLGLGVVIGPQLLGLVEVTPTVQTFSELGLGMLFFLAGYELDQEVLRGRPGALGGFGWLASVVAALVVTAVLVALDLVSDYLGIAIALTSTALGTLLPSLRDSGRLDTAFGRNFMGAGAFGEFGPILATSLFLSTLSPALALVSLVLFGVAAFVVAVAPSRFGTVAVRELLDRGHRTSSQTAVRWTVVLLLALLALSVTFRLDTVLGAFVAGIILKRYSPHSVDNVLVPKIETMGFGFFIPVFFIVSGIGLDVRSIVAHPLRLLILLVLLLVVRGLPQLLLYRRAIPDLRERWQFSLYVATGLPIIVAVTTSQTEQGLMRPENAAALVGAGALSVLVFPLLGDRIAARRVSPDSEEPAPA